MNQRVITFLFASTLLVTLSGFVAAQGNDEIQRCASIDETAARLACFDEIAGNQGLTSQPAETPAEPGPAQEVQALPEATPGEASSTADEPGSLTDDYGTEGLSKKDQPDEEEQAVRAVVTKCSKSSSDRYYFYFENGQVWKQKDDDRLYFKDCTYGVTITKDFFGYKMQIDGEKSKIRVSRVK